jgi:hypothetical protein
LVFGRSDVVQVKATMDANPMADKVKGSGTYDYGVKGECTIAFKERVDVGALGTESADSVEFTYCEPSARSRIAS